MDAVGADVHHDGFQEVQAVGVYLEEVSYFLEDMKKDLWWLLAAAVQPFGESLLRGDEELEEVDLPTAAIIQELRTRTEQHVESHGNQVRANIVIIPATTSEERTVLLALRDLRFHCKGQIDIFPCLKDVNNAALWAAYHKHAASQQPQWLVTVDGGPGQIAQKNRLFAQCIVVVPVWVDPDKGEIRLLHTFCPEKKKRHWACPGGDIIRGVDRSLYDAARREFFEEIGVYFGRYWSDCFTTELPAVWLEEINGPHACLYTTWEKDGQRYPCRPHLFAQVTSEFYNAMRIYEDSNCVIKMPQPQVDFVRWDDLSNAQRVHLEGVRFLKHDEAHWAPLDFNIGKLAAEDSRPVRRETIEVLKQRPKKLWDYFAGLLGVEPPEPVSMLPPDFPVDGHCAVRMSGIDKTASDDHIFEFFKSQSLEPKSVRQFEVPKHTAKVEFYNIEALGEALKLSSGMLLRRKVKIELWADSPDGVAPGGLGARPLKEFDGELPDEGPFQARCRGLDREVKRDDLGYFFWDRNCDVLEVLYPLNGEKHVGIVEFSDKEALRRALSLNNAVFKGREMTVELVSKKDRRSDGGRNIGRDRDGGRSGGRGNAKGGIAPPRGVSNREPPSREEFGSERGKIQLKSRSEQMIQGVSADTTFERGEVQRTLPPRTDPFGGARPREERFKPTRADTDHNWRR